MNDGEGWWGGDRVEYGVLDMKRDDGDCRIFAIGMTCGLCQRTTRFPALTPAATTRARALRSSVLPSPDTRHPHALPSHQYKPSTFWSEIWYETSEISSRDSATCHRFGHARTRTSASTSSSIQQIPTLTKPSQRLISLAVVSCAVDSVIWRATREHLKRNHLFLEYLRYEKKPPHV